MERKRTPGLSTSVSQHHDGLPLTKPSSHFYCKFRLIYENASLARVFEKILAERSRIDNPTYASALFTTSSSDHLLPSSQADWKAGSPNCSRIAAKVRP